jgi:hypothetical protein
MSLDEATLKRQLGRANEDMAVWIKVLETNGVLAANRRKDATWRRLNSATNTIRRRLKAVAAISARDEEAAKRKAEKLTAAVAVVEKPAKKASKVAKAPKAAKEPKAGGKEKGDGKKGEKGSEGKEKKKKE